MELAKKKETVHFLPLDVENMIKLGQRAKLMTKERRNTREREAARSQRAALPTDSCRTVINNNRTAPKRTRIRTSLPQQQICQELRRHKQAQRDCVTKTTNNTNFDINKLWKIEKGI